LHQLAHFGKRAEQVIGREGETMTFLSKLSVKFRRTLRRFRPTSTPPLSGNEKLNTDLTKYKDSNQTAEKNFPMEISEFGLLLFESFQKGDDRWHSSGRKEFYAKKYKKAG